MRNCSKSGVVFPRIFFFFFTIFFPTIFLLLSSFFLLPSFFISLLVFSLQVRSLDIIFFSEKIQEMKVKTKEMKEKMKIY